jgi:outer membrane protein assembly factor BamB
MKGSDPSVLPANVLIADWGARRLLVVSPQGQIVWNYGVKSIYGSQFNPDYAFFDAAGDSITISEESHSIVEQLGVAKRKVLYRYGHYNHPGSPSNYLHDPGTAITLSDGTIVAADIRNCRVSVLHPPSHFHAHNLGHVGHCVHNPPHHYDDPVSAFPLRGGGLVITELSGAVDLLDATGKLKATFAVPGFKRPFATNMTPQGDLVAVDHTRPGGVEIFSTRGKLIWHYAPKLGQRELFDPSMAIVLPNGDVLVSDDDDSRVIVIDRQTKKIVWQYGHLHRRSGANGYLYLPVGVDLVHPDSLLDGFTTAVAPG